jgi:hypothetical protein
MTCREHRRLIICRARGLVTIAVAAGVRPPRPVAHRTHSSCNLIHDIVLSNATWNGLTLGGTPSSLGWDGCTGECDNECLVADAGGRAAVSY